MLTLPTIVITGKTISQVALEIAISQHGVHESGGNNRGPEVDEYVRTAGLDPTRGYPWCASFMYWCFQQAARLLGIANPFPKTAKAVEIWNRVSADPNLRICLDSNPSVGAVYILDHGSKWITQLPCGRLTDDGHTGIAHLLDLHSQLLTELSGNTNDSGSREGNAVAEHAGSPEVSHKGTLIGWVQFDRAPIRRIVV